jgi:hypothetical protein
VLQEPYYYLAYAIYLVLTHLPLLVVLLSLSMLLCCWSLFGWYLRILPHYCCGCLISLWRSRRGSASSGSGSGAGPWGDGSHPRGGGGTGAKKRRYHKRARAVSAGGAMAAIKEGDEEDTDEEDEEENCEEEDREDSRLL